MEGFVQPTYIQVAKRRQGDYFAIGMFIGESEGKDT
jgi:hypothetical protein